MSYTLILHKEIWLSLTKRCILLIIYTFKTHQIICLNLRFPEHPLGALLNIAFLLFHPLHTLSSPVGHGGD